MDFDKLPFVIKFEKDIDLKIIESKNALCYLDQMAFIRVNLFKEFPYLYEGNLDEERVYLSHYTRSARSLLCLVLDKGKPVGFASGLVLDDFLEEVKAPFKKLQLDLKSYFYIGEILIYPIYRSFGLLKKVFELLEAYAYFQKYSALTFVTVDRRLNHSAYPQEYRSLEPVWQYFGYKKELGMRVEMSWRQVDSHNEEKNTLSVWNKFLR